MEKWADYGIFAVRFNATGTHIDAVQAYPDNGTSFGTAVTYSRPNVVGAIKRGVTFVTIVKNAGGKWIKGQPVYVTQIGGVEYLETVENKTKVDNLDNLPQF